MHKSVLKIDKKFSFSDGFKKLIEGIFLKKVKSFEEIQTDEWYKGDVFSPQ